jgi:DNA gyrase subunit A
LEIMTESVDPQDVPLPNLALNVRDQLLDQEMKESYLSYAMSVIIQRALPDVRDGLKPSQRRILVVMNDLNLGPRSKFRKCMKIVGDTTGNYHPHGDAAVYPTLVRLAQDFNMRYPLIDPQGNFGYVDGSPPAAARYTEARMTAAAVDMLEDLDKDTVDFVPNYDDTRTEPTVLPGRFPHLLCNGSQGIAVGMATSMPPHNVREICDAIIELIRNPKLTFSQLLAIVPGPDFPTGGIICGTSGIIEAYKAGRGLISVRGKVSVEERRGDRQSIVITELPYQVNPNSIFDRLKELISEGEIKGITNVNDETDREAGLRLVIDVRKGDNVELIINQLYKLTPLQSTFSIIMLALDKGRPRTMSLIELMGAWRDHRVEVIQRRTRYLLRKALERCHIVEGLRIAVQNIDAVVKTIKESADPQAAALNLIARFGLSKRQAEAILAMRLARLTSLEVTQLEDEYAKLLADIAGYKKILADITIVHQMIIDDLEDVKSKYGDKRRTAIEAREGDITDESLIEELDTTVTVSRDGYIKRLGLGAFRNQSRGGRGVTGADLKDGDFIERLIIANTKDYFLVFTDRGRLLWLRVYEIPEMARTARGRALVNVLQMQEGETVASIIPVRDFADDRYVMMVTVQGTIKKTPLSAFSNVRVGGIIACTLDEGDRLVRTLITDGKSECIIGTAQGQAIRFQEDDVRPMGRAARGVRAIRIEEGDRVVDMVVCDSQGSLLTVSEHGYGKRTPYEDYRLQSRGGSGVINIKTNERNGQVVAMLAAKEGDHLMMVSERGMIVRTEVGQVRMTGRNTLGVRLMKLDENDRLVACAVIPEDLLQENAAAQAVVPESAPAGSPDSETPEEPS